MGRCRSLGRCAGAAAVLLALLSACSSNGDETSGTTVTTVAPESTTTTEPSLEAGRQVFVFTPAVGQCFDRRQLEERPTTGPQQTDVVLILDCSLPHQNEVFAVIDPPGAGRDFPGETVMQDFARRNCAQGFAAYVGRPYETSELEVGHYLPSSSEWESGARRLGCYLYDVGGDKLLGTMQGSGR